MAHKSILLRKSSGAKSGVKTIWRKSGQYHGRREKGILNDTVSGSAFRLGLRMQKEEAISLCQNIVKGVAKWRVCTHITLIIVSR